MNFAEWLGSQENSEGEQEIIAFINQLKSAVLSSMKVEDGIVTFSFPRNVAVASPILQAAWTVPPGKLIEGGWEKEGGKGKVIYGKIQPFVKWNPQQVKIFQQGMDKQIRNISKEMGLLFEIETFLYLTDVIGLKAITPTSFEFGANDSSASNTWAYKERDDLINTIKTKRRINPEFADMVVEFVQLHATGPDAQPPGMPNGMGHLIYQKTQKLIGGKCKVDTVTFMGGQSGKAGETNRADLSVGCERVIKGRSHIGYVMKFGSEPTQQAMSTTYSRLLGMLSGDKKSVKGWLNGIRQYEGKDKVRAYAQKIYDLASPRFDNNPQRFVNLLEFLTLGSGENLPAMRYYTRNLGEPGWSGAFQMDFRTGEGSGRKLGARIDQHPTVKLGVTPNYMRMVYQLPKGGPRTKSGTAIEFWPQEDETVHVKITNLTSLGGRGY